MNCSVRETLCWGDVFHYSALLPPLSNHCTQCSLPLSSFDHAGIVCSSLSLLSFFLPIILNAISVVPNSGDMEKKKKKSTMGLICQTRDTEMCCENIANNVRSKIIKLPVWLIIKNIWQGFVLWICLGFRFWCHVKTLNKCFVFQRVFPNMM